MLSRKLLGSGIPGLTSAVNNSGGKDSANEFYGDEPGADPDVDAVESVVDASSGEDLKETDRN